MKKSRITFIWGILTCVVIGVFILLNNQDNKSISTKGERIKQISTSEEQKSTAEADIDKFLTGTAKLIQTELKAKGYKEIGGIGVGYQPGKTEKVTLEINTLVESSEQNISDFGGKIETVVNDILQTKEAKSLLVFENQILKVNVYSKDGKKIN
ncbi:hypothetical protein J2S09_005056 [Bacillus fengqiuensis]|nr:hypothetical protein [Bacillus fengqiuensis]